ncbi:MAG: FHA domain-containing protein [Pyrinomonadaceae bacterium]
MSNALLSIAQPGHDERKLTTEGEVVSIGRAVDNTICLQDDTNVSRYHAEIEKRDKTFFIVDLGSSNGTTVNDVPVEFERKLENGDVIMIGGSTTIVYRLIETSVENAAAAAVPNSSAEPPQNAMSAAPSLPDANVAAKPSISLPSAQRGPSALLIVAGVAGGLVLTAVVAVLIFAVMSRNKCSASIHIVSPQNGTTVHGPIPIRLEVEGTKCIERVVYQIDGVEVASAETNPYDLVLDPARLKNIGSGNHTLSVAIEDTAGNKNVEETLLLAFDAADSGPSPGSAADQGNADQNTVTSIQDPALDIRSLADRLAGQISRKSGYVFDRDFVQLIRSRTDEYRVHGYTDRARRYRREINKAFRDQGLDPLLGYLLAMSRSKFNENVRGDGIGLWQIPYSLAQSQGYLTSGESEETLKDPKRSAEIAAAYTKALASTFESTDDFMFAVSCFGLPLNQAGLVRTQLATVAPDPLARRDFLKMVKLGVVKGDQVDRVVRFFAAGIVTENPQAFGLQNDEPFSSLF